MAANVTLLQMRTDARERADMAGGAAAAFASDTLLTRWVNDACKELYDKLVAARGGDYYAARDTLSLVAGTASYALPATFFQLLAVQIDYGGDVCDLGRYELREEALLLSAPVSTDPRALRWRLESQTMRFAPTPAVASTVRLVFVPAFADLVNDGDTFDGVNGWERWATMTVAIRLRQKAKHDVGDLMAERQRVEAAIDRLADHRDGQPATIVDVRRDHAFGWSYAEGID